MYPHTAAIPRTLLSVEEGRQSERAKRSSAMGQGCGAFSRNGGKLPSGMNSGLVGMPTSFSRFAMAVRVCSLGKDTQVSQCELVPPFGAS